MRVYKSEMLCEFLVEMSKYLNNQTPTRVIFSNVEIKWNFYTQHRKIIEQKLYENDMNSLHYHHVLTYIIRFGYFPCFNIILKDNIKENQSLCSKIIMNHIRLVCVLHNYDV